MSENIETRLENIDLATLTLLVRSALSSETAVVVKWNYDTMQGGYSGNSSIYCFLGSGQDQGREIAWSLILKILQRGNQVDNPAHSRYWKREAVAFESGILEHLPGSVIAPKCFGITKPSDDECWIWLEEVKSETGSHWPLEQYGSVARHLGQFNGAYLTGAPQPARSWLSENWLRELVSGSASAIDLLRDSLKHPLISRWFPESVAQDTFRLWEERETILDMLDRLPQTFCHRDANWRKKVPDNLFESFCGQDTVQGCWNELFREFVDDIRGQGNTSYPTFYDGWIHAELIDIARNRTGWQEISESPRVKAI